MNSKRPVIVVEPGMGQLAMDALHAAGDVRVLTDVDEPSLITAVADCEALVVRSDARVTASVINAAASLRVIGRAGVGLERVDIDAARRRDIPVVYTPAASTHSVAELTVGLMLALERRVTASDPAIREGRFADARKNAQGRELHGLTLGIIGLGRIGSAVATLAGVGIGMKLLYNDISPPDELPFFRSGTGDALHGQIAGVDTPTLFANADVITLHVPLTNATHGLIDADALRQFKPSATLINTARGAVVNADHLADALNTGRPAGAAIDVFDPEPPPPDHPLLHAPNLLLTPHIGARTHAAMLRMDNVVRDVIAVLQDRPPRFTA